MTKPIVLVGALDTKGREFAFVRDLLAGRGLDTIVVNFGVIGDSPFEPDVTASWAAFWVWAAEAAPRWPQPPCANYRSACPR